MNFSIGEKLERLRSTVEERLAKLEAAYKNIDDEKRCMDSIQSVPDSTVAGLRLQFHLEADRLAGLKDDVKLSLSMQLRCRDTIKRRNSQVAEESDVINTVTAKMEGIECKLQESFSYTLDAFNVRRENYHMASEDMRAVILAQHTEMHSRGGSEWDRCMEWKRKVVRAAKMERIESERKLIRLQTDAI